MSDEFETTEDIAPEASERLTRFYLRKTRAARGKPGMRIVGCPCCRPEGTVRRCALHRYQPLANFDLCDVVGIDLEREPPLWSVYDRREERFLETAEVMAIPEGALMFELLDERDACDESQGDRLPTVLYTGRA